MHLFYNGFLKTLCLIALSFLLWSQASAQGVIYSENFDDPTNCDDAGSPWTASGDAGRTDDESQSASCSIFAGTSSGSINMSPIIDLSDYTNVNVSAWIWEEAPEEGDFVSLQYQTASGAWVGFESLRRMTGENNNFSASSLNETLPSEAVHANSRFRMRVLFASGAADDAWYIDDFTLTGNGPVQGTAGNDTMGLGFTDADGDQITAGADIVEGLGGDDTFRAEDEEAHGDTLRGGEGIDRLENAYAGTFSGTGQDLHINAETTLDSVEIIDGSAGSTDQDVMLDGNGTFDLTSVTNLVRVNSFKHGAESGSLTVQLPNLVDNTTFDLDGGENVAVDIQMGSGNDIFLAEDLDAYGDTLRGGDGTDRLENAYTGTATGAVYDLQIDTATMLDSVEIIDGSAGSTAQDVTLDGNGTFDLSSVTDLVSVNSFKHGAESGSLTVLLPNLVDNATFDLDGGETVAADIQVGSGNDTFLAEDLDAYGDTLRGGTGTDRLENGYAGTATTGAYDLHITAATIFDSVELIDGSSGSTAQDLRLDGTGTFDLTSVTDFTAIRDIYSDASSGAITVLLPNLNENLSGTFFLDDGADVTFVYGTNVIDRRAFVELGSGNDTVTGGRGNDRITLGGGSDTVVLYDGFNDGAGNDNVYGFTAGGDDQLDVSAMTDTGGGEVTADEVTVGSLNGGADTRLTFPNGERIRLYGVAFADMNEESELAAAGIPAGEPLVVTSTADTNTLGTLRYAINYANTNITEDNITFNIAGMGPHTIALASALPAITDAGISIDGTTQSDTLCGSTPNANGGISDRALQIQIDGTGIASSPNDDTVIVNADNVTVSGVAVYGALDVPFVVNGGDNFTLLCSHIGVDAGGLTTYSNNDSAMWIASADNVQIGDGTLAGLNVFGGGSLSGLEFDSFGPSNAPIIKRNFFGLGIDGITPVANTVDGLRLEATTNAVVGDALGGGNVMSGNGEDGIMVRLGASATILGNFVGTNGIGTTIVQNGDEGIAIETSGTSATIGDGSVAGRNIIGGNLDANIDVLSSSTAVIDNNLIGIGAGGQPMGGLDGIYMSAGSSAIIRNNIIANNSSDGIVIFGNTSAAIYANSIFNNVGQGIDLGGNNVSLNDVGDGDSGSNDLLNFPVINSVGANGSASLDYDITLDVPANTPGYRIDFFKNTSADPTGYGEGEIYLGTIDVSGSGNHTGSFTAGETVDVGDIISTTTTRKTASSFDITSEFSETVASISSVSPLVVTSVADTNTLGTLRYAINNSTANDTITFNITGAGPHVISPTSALPEITEANIIIDGETQPSASCGQLTTGTQHDLRIRIDGSSAGTSVTGIAVSGSDVILRGLSITNFDGFGIGVSFGGDNFTGECLYVGVEPDGTTKGPNAKSSTITPGVRLFTMSNGTVRNSLLSGNDDDGFDRGIRFQSVTSGTIEGNIIGLNAAGLTALGNGSDGIFLDGTTSGITIGGVNAASRNIVSGNGEAGIKAEGNVSNINILGNYIGLGADALTPLPNTEDGIILDNVTDINVGDGTANGRNLIAADGIGVYLTGTTANVSVNNNYFNTDSTGNSSIVNGQDGIVLNGDLTTLDIVNNVVGQVSEDKIEFFGVFNGTDIKIQGNNLGVGADSTSDISGGSGLLGFRVWPNFTLTGLELGGADAGQGNIIANNGGAGIDLGSPTTGEIVGNTIYSNDDDGIKITSATAALAIYSNSISGNTGLGIDLGTTGITDNDSGGGDADTGTNDLLNFPLINQISAEGTTSVSYSVELDVPANTEGYRIEFFKNTSPDTTNGEGEIFLGFVDTGDHAGGAISYDGTFTASENVSVGDSISATTTRKTGATNYDITSEFAVNVTAVSPLVVTNINDSGAGSLRAAIDYANSVTTADNITFAIPGTGPHVITPLTALPNITDAGISIDGSTQSGANCGSTVDSNGGINDRVLKIQIDGSSTSGTVQGLRATQSNVAIRGISVTGFPNYGVLQVGTTITGFNVSCSHLGVDPTGMTGAPNGQSGVLVYGINALIGGPTIADRNVVSGNTQYGIYAGTAETPGVGNVTISGNYIGVGIDGITDIGNTLSGIVLYGGAHEISGFNVISGNKQFGVSVGRSDNTGSGAGSVITGAYIGVGSNGTTTVSNTLSGVRVRQTSNITIGGTSSETRNIISGNLAQGILTEEIDTVTIIGNYIGLGQDGVTAVGNSSHGVYANNAANLIIGGTATGAGNVISSNIGSGTDGVWLLNTTTATLLGNFIGTDFSGTLNRGNGDEGVFIQNGAIATIGDGTIAGRNVIAGNGGANIYSILGDATVDVNNNLIGIGTNGEAIGGEDGVHFANNSIGTVRNNVIAHNAGAGVWLRLFPSDVSIFANSIHSNGGLGINLAGGVETNDVTANDTGGGDSDTGPNDLLNFPAINDFATDGNTAMSYDINLDVPSGDYRIDFYRNSAADSSGHGEGEFHLGFVELTHIGGNQQHTGTFTANSAVVQGNYIAATTTRKTGPSAYDITSEFSLTTTTGSPTELTAVKSVNVYDPTNAGLYSLPGNDVISSLTVTNPGSSAADADSIVIIDAIPAEVTFYNGPIDDVGGSNPISFEQTGGANLTFTYSSDVRYSNSGIRPTDMSGCTYSPSAGYDTNVTFICLNPKGAMAAGNPDPTFTVAYRAKIK